jgi:DNA polymerase III subunit delta
VKYTNRRAFEKHLEAAHPKHFADVYLVIAKDNAERKEAIDILTGYLLKGQVNSQLSLKSFDADRLTTDLLLPELNGFSFLAGKQILMINQEEKLSKPVQEALEAYFSHPNHSLSLIISAAKIQSNTNFYKKAEKCGVILDIPEEKPWEKEKTMKESLLERATKSGKKMDLQTAAFFLKRIGCDQATLQSEFEKVLCYVGDRPHITSQDIAAICTITNLENGWQLGESIFKCDVKGSLRIVRALMEDRNAFLTLLRQIRSQFQTEFQICSILASGGTSQDITVRFPYMKGMILDRHIQSAQNYGIDRFKAGLLKIDEAELKFKSNSPSPDILMETLIIKLATK